MTSRRAAPSAGFVPTTSRTRASAAGTSSAASSRAASLSRPPSAAGPSRPGSALGLGTGATSSLGVRTRSIAGIASSGEGAGGRTSSVDGSAAPTTTGLKRKTRTGSGTIENGTFGGNTAKRPTLSSHTSAFNSHVSQTSLNRQLLAAQAKVTELENALLDKQGKLERIESDLSRIVDSEETERKGRLKAEEELSKLTSQYQTVTSSLKGKLVQLEAEHEEVSDAYSLLAHQVRSQKSEIATLQTELIVKDKEIALLESQRDETEERNAEMEERVAALEEMLERALAEAGDTDEEGEGVEEEGEGVEERNEEARREQNVEPAGASTDRFPDEVQGVVEEVDELDIEHTSDVDRRLRQPSAGLDIFVQSRESTIDPALDTIQGVAEEIVSTAYDSDLDMLDGEGDDEVDADGSVVDPGEDMSMVDESKSDQGTAQTPAAPVLDTPVDDHDVASSIASTPRIELRRDSHLEELLPVDGEVEIFNDPGAPPPYTTNGPVIPDFVSSSPLRLSEDAESDRNSFRSQSVGSLKSNSPRAQAYGHAPRVAHVVHDYDRDVDSDSEEASESNYAPSSVSQSRSATPTQPRSPSVLSASAYVEIHRHSVETPIRATRSHDKKKLGRPSVTHPSLSANLSMDSPLDPLSQVRRRLSSATPTKSPKPRRQSRTSLLSQSQSLGLLSGLSPSISASSLRSRENDSEIIRKELANQTEHMKSLEATNMTLSAELARLKARVTSAEVLREEKRELQKRVEGVEWLRRRVAELEASHADFDAQRGLWEREKRERADNEPRMESSSSQDIPMSVAHQLTTLRKAHAALLDEHGELKATARANEIERNGAQEEAENLRCELEGLRVQTVERAEDIARKEREKQLLQKEVLFLRSLVSSYKDESLADISMSESDVDALGMPPSSSAASMQALERHAEDLERLLDEYKGTMVSLEAEVERLHRVSATSANKSQAEWEQVVRRISELENTLQGAQASVAEREIQIDKLEQQLFELGAEIGCGRHVPPNTRVLSLKQNPAQEWADTRTEILERLKKENQVLLGRVSELESRVVNPASGASSGESTTPGESEHLVPRASYDVLKEEITSLQDVLSAKEKRLLRLTQVFTAKSAEFRDAIASILGLKLAFYPNGQVRVTSVYDLSASFVFQPDTKPKSIMRRLGKDNEEAGVGEMKMQLIAAGEGGPVEMEGLMNTWIRDEMCIPCFMASITLECYDKMKMEQVS